MLKWATGAVVLWMGLQIFETRCVGLMPILYSHSDKTKMIATSPLKIFGAVLHFLYHTRSQDAAQLH